MPSNVTPIQTTFNGGIFSPLLDGFINAPRRESALKDSTNLIPLKQGPLVRRGGTLKTYQPITAVSEILPFIYNDEQAYIIEFSDGFMRVYKDDDVVKKASSSFTISGITAASPPVVTATGHTFVNGNWVYISGLTEAVELNNRWFRANGVSGSTFELTLQEYPWVSGSATPAAAPATAETSSTGSVDCAYFISSPYDAADLFDSDDLFRLKHVQSNDVMYIAHPDFQPRALARTADNSWTITKLENHHGPYLPENQTDITCTLSAVSTRTFTVTTSEALVVASDTLTQAAGGDANNLGTATEVNRLFCMNVDNDLTDDPDSGAEDFNIPIRNKWIWGEITAYNTATEFEWTIHEESRLPAEAGTASVNLTSWRLGAYCDTTGFPEFIDIHEGRIVTAGGVNYPRRVDFSTVNGFTPTTLTWDPYSYQHEIRPDDGFTANIGGGNASPIHWIKSTDRGLVVGTNNSEGTIAASNTSEKLSPENVSYTSGTTIGSRRIPPLYINGALLFAQSAGRRLHELTYSFESDRLVAPDMTELAEHLTRGKIIAMAYQQEPLNTIWVVLENGELLGMTYERNSDVLGWHRHPIGGTDAKVKDIAVIPVPAQNRDEVWLKVSRTVNGATTYFIERLGRWYEEDIEREDIVQQDSSFQFTTTKVTITNIEDYGAQNRVKITAASHGLSDGDKVYLNSIVGFTKTNDDDSVISLNQKTFVVADSAANDFQLKDLGNSYVDASDYSTYTSGGTLQESVGTFRGMDLLEGETVEIYVDGKTHPNKAITSGAIVLDQGRTGANVSIGLPTTWHMETLNWEHGSRNGTAQGKKQKISKLIARLRNTLGFKYGPDADNLDEESFDYGGASNSPTPLFTGDLRMSWPDGWSVGAPIYLKGEGPFPAQIQALIPVMKTSDTVGS